MHVTKYCGKYDADRAEIVEIKTEFTTLRKYWIILTNIHSYFEKTQSSLKTVKMIYL